MSATNGLGIAELGRVQRSVAPLVVTRVSCLRNVAPVAAATGASSPPVAVMRVLATGKSLQTLSVRHGSAMGRIALKFGHTTPWSCLRPSGQKDRCGTCL